MYFGQDPATETGHSKLFRMCSRASCITEIVLTVGESLSRKGRHEVLCIKDTEVIENSYRSIRSETITYAP